jgi:hypothetical protein
MDLPEILPWKWLATTVGNLTRPNHDAAPVVNLYRLVAPVNCRFAKQEPRVWR